MKYCVTFETVYPKTEQVFFNEESEVREFVSKLKNQYYTVTVKTNENIEIYTLDSSFWS